MRIRYLGQVKKAHEFLYATWVQVKRYLINLFREAVNTAKEIKNTTKISESAIIYKLYRYKTFKKKIGMLQSKNA